MLFVDYPFLFSGSINFIKKIIKNKKYGKLLEIESFREQAPIRQDADVVWDLGVHDISILKHWLNQNPIKIKSIKYNTVKTSKKGRKVRNKTRRKSRRCRHKSGRKKGKYKKCKK